MVAGSQKRGKKTVSQPTIPSSSKCSSSGPPPPSSSGFVSMNEAQARVIVEHRCVGAVKSIMVPSDKEDKFTNRPKQNERDWFLIVKTYFHTNAWQWTSKTNHIVYAANLYKDSASGWALRDIN